jgi:hypothetical protein
MPGRVCSFALLFPAPGTHSLQHRPGQDPASVRAAPSKAPSRRFNSDQSITNDIGIADVLDPNTPQTFTLKRVTARTGRGAGKGSLTALGSYDTTEIGGYVGPSVITCAGPNGERASFTRKGATSVFNVKVTASGRSFQQLVASGVSGVLSLGGLDRRDDIGNCKVHGNRTQTLICK